MLSICLTCARWTPARWGGRWSGGCVSGSVTSLTRVAAPRAPPGARRVQTSAIQRSVTHNTQTASTAPPTPANLVSSARPGHHSTTVNCILSIFFLHEGCLADKNCPEDMMCLDGRCVTGYYPDRHFLDTNCYLFVDRMLGRQKLWWRIWMHWWYL